MEISKVMLEKVGKGQCLSLYGNFAAPVFTMLIIDLTTDTNYAWIASI